ncbi:MAG: DNA translocase FtsK, partial [Planctomycetaceae bacterium]|nr:DNA translocase FtsK [Planctomycetaceae bacterium]
APPLLTAAVSAIAEETDDKDANAETTRVKKKTKRDERNQLMQEFDAAAKLTDEANDYELPPIDLLLESEPMQLEEQEKEVLKKAKILEKTFANFGFNVKVVEIETGPVIAQYEVELEAGLRLSKITGLSEDLAIALRVPSVRIVAPIPGKNTVGIEVPNAERQIVRLREVIEESNAKVQKMRIPIYLGKDVAGNPLVVDLASLPHLLIAGRTGTGKSVCLNTLIASMLMTRRPDEVRMLLIDPKMVELSAYKTLPHLMHPVVTDMRKAEAILAWAVEKMEERYALLARAGVRHIAAFNQLGEAELMERLQPESDEERKAIPTHLPYIVIVADEIADLMMTAAKEVETHIIRLAQKSRAVGIHLVLATQKPTVDVITGLIKSNLPARICFQVASRTDSRVVLDEMGADKLLGNGDLLFLWPGTSTLLRGQGTYVSDDEINKVVEFVGTTEQQFVEELVQLKAAAPGETDADRFKARDDLYEAAIDVVVREGRGSVSLLQRALGIGYGRAARLIDFMAEDGFVGTYNGSQAREVLISIEQWETMQGQSGGGGEKPSRANKVTPERDTGSKSSNSRKALPPPDYEDEDGVETGYEDDDEADEVADEDEDLFAERDEKEFEDDQDIETPVDADDEDDDVPVKPKRPRRAM